MLPQDIILILAGYLGLMDLCALSQIPQHRSNRFFVVKLLIEKGADVNIGNIHGETPIMVASQKNHQDVVQHLAENGAKMPSPIIS